MESPSSIAGICAANHFHQTVEINLSKQWWISRGKAIRSCGKCSQWHGGRSSLRDISETSAIGEQRLFLCPGGTHENSPAFQRWVCLALWLSPAGTAEAAVLSRPCGTSGCSVTVPALKRWAIVRHPSGMR
jgi:hypothetical protein